MVKAISTLSAHTHIHEGQGNKCLLVQQQIQARFCACLDVLFSPYFTLDSPLLNM